MGIQHDIGFVAEQPNVVQRGMQRVASTRIGSWVFQRTLFLLDRPLHRWTRGRLTVPGLVAGLPVVLLTTTGARTGRPRTMPLAAVPFGDDVAIIGTNYGQPRTPGWVHNLVADPRATLTWRDRTVDVVATPIAGDQMDDLWRAAAGFYSGFARYRDRITGRDVRAFVLERPT